jgi:hypothetical protein
MVCFFNWFFAAAFCLPPLSLLLPNPNPVLQKIVLTLVLLPLLLALIVQLVHCFCFEYPHLLLLILLHHSRTRERVVLFIGTQFSNLYSAVDTPARGRVGKCRRIHRPASLSNSPTSCASLSSLPTSCSHPHPVLIQPSAHQGHGHEMR